MKTIGAQYLLVIAVLMLCLIVIAMAAFDEVPVFLEVPVGSKSMCRCQHSTADFIRWRVNGTVVGRRPPPDITPGSFTEDGNLVDTLTIVARLEYNGTIVVCVAEFDDGTPDEPSEPPAMLLVQADENITNDTQEFITSPLSVNVTVGTETMFHCEHSNADGLSWFINGTVLRSQPDLHNTFRESTSGSVRTLTVTALSRYNSTRIECIAFFSSDQPSETTPPALLVIQGPLAAVRSLTKVNNTISWEPPFSLDLTNVDPDIVYCVDVYNITCGGRDLVSSDCSVTDTNYTSLSDGYLYEYIVTPRSNVEGAQNGTARYLRDALPLFSLSSSELSLSSPDSTIIDYQIELSYTPVFPVPSSYALSLEELDGLSNLDNVETISVKQQPSLLLSVTGLESRRLWSCVILAFGCQEHSLVSSPLSTHDFQGISISSPSAGVVRVTGRFVEGSPSTGILAIVSGDSGFSYHISTRDSSDSHAVTISGLAGGDYIVSVFVVEENGLPFERAAMLPGHQIVETNTIETPPPTIEYSLESNSTGVCVQCNFLDVDTSECIVVVHRDLVNIESSHTFTRSGDTASGCIEGVNVENRQVGVIGGRLMKSGPPRSSNLTVLIAALVPAVVILAVIVIVLLIIVKVHYGKYHDHAGTGDAEKTQNYYTTHTSVPAPPTENPRIPLVVQSLERSVGIYDTVTDVPSDSPPPFLTPPSSVSSDITQASTVSTSVSESSTEDGNTPLYSRVGVKQQPSSSGEASAVVADSAEQSGTSLYSQVDVKSQSISVPPVDDKPVVYSEVIKTQGANNQLYAMVNPKKSTIDTYPDDLTKVVYSEIRPHGVEQPLQAASAESISTVPPPPPFTIDNVVAALIPVASKWQAIGEAFPLSQKRLDDIETTEGDEQCLRETIEAYMLRRDLNHTWDEIINVLKNKKVKEERLAEQIYVMHVAPYVLTLPNQPQLPESGMYTHGSKPLLQVRQVSTDDGSLDTSSPVPSHQQTVPATSVSSEEREVKPNEEESLPTHYVTVCAPESHHNVAVLEMPPYDDVEGFNSCRSRCTGPKRRVDIDGDSTEVENDLPPHTGEDAISSKGEAPDDVPEVSCDSSKGRVATDGDSGVSEGQESSLPSEKEDDLPSQLTDAGSSSIESEVEAPSDVEKATHQVTAKPAQVVGECSQEDYKSEVPLPSSSNESQRGKPDHGGDPVASTSEVNGSLVTPKRADTQVDGGQSDDHTRRTGSPTVQDAQPLQDTYIPKQKQMEHGIGNDFVPPPAQCSIEEASGAFQEREPHSNYFSALAHQNGKVYVPRPDRPLRQVELTPAELTDEPVEEAEPLVSMCDTESTQCDEDQTAPIPVYDTVAEQQMFPLHNAVNGAKVTSDEETTVKHSPPFSGKNKNSKAFMPSKNTCPYSYISPVKHNGNRVERTSTRAKRTGLSFSVYARRRRHLRPRWKRSPQYQPLNGTEPDRHVVACNEEKGGVMNGCLNFAHPMPQQHCSYTTNDLQHTLCSYLPSKYVQTPSRAVSKWPTTRSCDLQATPTTAGAEWHQFLQLSNGWSCIRESDSSSPSRSVYLTCLCSPFPV